MDVRCERCKTEYEFDDARITEAGVTVKCTTCGHVFKVKKKALVVTVPVKPGELDQAHAPLTQSPGSSLAASGADRAADKSKEWKVRQANGNVFTFKELTTLQKWIVERKVSREDEISLTGESWKRLGNIAELASFFQVTEEAQKGAQLSALAASGVLGMSAPLSTPGGGYPAQSGLTFPPSPPQLAPVANAPITQPMMPAMSAPVPPVAPQPVPVQASVVPAPVPVVAAPPPQAAAPIAPPPQPVAAPVAAAPAPLPMAPSRIAPPSSGGAGKWIAVLLGILVLGGGAAAGYQFWWLPQEAQKAERAAQLLKAQAENGELRRAAADAQTKPKTPAEPPVAVAVTPAAVVDAGSAPVAGTELAAASVIDAGTVAVSGEDGGKVVTAKVKKEPTHDFGWYMAQADRLRDREKAEAALDAYGRAADLEPDRPEPIAGRGLALLDMGSKLQAEAAFQQALKLNARYPVAIMGLAETYKAQGKKEQAIQFYQRYLEVAPQGPEAAIAKGAIQKLSE